MFRVALTALLTHRIRTALAGLAVVLGVGTLGGSIVYGDTAKAAFFDDLARSAVGVDAVARPSGSRPGLVGRAALDAVAAVPGVAHADGRVITEMGLLDRRGRVISNGTSVGFAISVPQWSGLAMFRTTTGRLPERTGEAALDLPTAARERLIIGDRVTVLDRDRHPHAVSVVGVLDFGASAQFADTSVVALSEPDLSIWTRVENYAEIVIAAEPGTDADELRQRIAHALGQGYAVDTGDELRREISVESAKYVDGFLSTLRATALVALVVACLVVYNTLQILVAQRTRQHALLRCVGASQRQIAGLVLAESSLLGLIASIVSVIVGVIAGLALLVGRDVFGSGMPDFQLVVSPLAIIVPLVTGTAVTVISGVAPALSAGRVSPLAALRASADVELSAGPDLRRRSLTAVLALALVGCGVVLLNFGRGQGFDGLTPMVGGAMAVFVAVVLVLPLMVTHIAGPLRWILGRVFGVAGRVAMGNARRHPVRFAAATAALMIGCAPLTTFAVILTTARVQADRELAENFPIDFVLSHADFGDGPPRFSSDLTERLRQAPEFGGITLSRVANAYADGCCSLIAAAEPGTVGTRVTPEVMSGVLGGLRPATAAIDTAFATSHGLGVGDTIQVGPEHRTWAATVVALFDDTPIPGQVLVNWSDFTAHLNGDDYLLIRRSQGTSAAAAGAALDAAVADDPLAVVSSVAQRRESLAASLDRRLVHFDVLLGVSALIAILGIANTLSLSVLERTQESAVLRAIGLRRRQLYAVLLIEAVLMALVGALIGVAFGLGFGWFAADELITAYGHGTPDIPVLTITSYVALATVAGCLAAVLPARRAARASIVDTIADA